MKKLYEIRITFDTGRKIHGPVFSDDDREQFVGLVNHYDDLGDIKLEDAWRRIVIPQEMLKRSYIEIRRISWLRFLCRIILRVLIT